MYFKNLIIKKKITDELRIRLAIKIFYVVKISGS